MTRISFTDLKIGTVGSSSSINTGMNRLSGRRNVSQINEAQGHVSGDHNEFISNWFAVKDSQIKDIVPPGKPRSQEGRQ